MNKNARFVFWSLFLVAVYLFVWFCFAFYGVAAVVEGASDCGLVVGIFVVFGFLVLPAKAKRAIEEYMVGGGEDA